MSKCLAREPAAPCLYTRHIARRFWATTLCCPIQVAGTMGFWAVGSMVAQSRAVLHSAVEIAVGAVSLIWPGLAFGEYRGPYSGSSQRPGILSAEQETRPKGSCVRDVGRGRQRNHERPPSTILSGAAQLFLFSAAELSQCRQFLGSGKSSPRCGLFFSSVFAPHQGTVSTREDKRVSGPQRRAVN